MVLGAVTGVGHARLSLERFGKFWGAFSIFLERADHRHRVHRDCSRARLSRGFHKGLGVTLSAIAIMAAASTGNFRRFERFSMALVFASLLLVPVFLVAHPPVAQITRDFVVPQLPQGAKLREMMLLVIAIVATTVAPWQLFFQQSYVIDKRITPRFISYRPQRVEIFANTAPVPGLGRGHRSPLPLKQHHNVLTFGTRSSH
jgi:Mn2+/Fe2+ NRAMP family transporter